MRICPFVIVAVLLPVLFAHAGSGRIVIAEGGKHRVLVVDRETRAIINEKSDFRRVDCLAVVATEEFVICDASQFVRLGADLTERTRTPVAFARVGSVTAIAERTLHLAADTLKRGDSFRHIITNGAGTYVGGVIPNAFP